MIASFSIGLLLTLSGTPAAATAPDALVASGPALQAPAAGSAALERGLASLSVDNISADIHFIASDEMRGRDTVSAGQRITARYIRARLKRLGFQPGNGDAFLWEYPLDLKALDRDGLSASVAAASGEVALSYGKDYVLTDSFGVAALSNSAEVVHCGSGNSKDFVAETLRGKWALCEFTEQSAYRLRSRARKAGAVGLILAPGEGSPNLIEHFAEHGSQAFEGRVAWPAQASRGRTPFPVLAISDQTLELLQGGTEVLAGASFPASFSETRVLAGGGQVQAENVVGFWPGSDPELSKEVLIVSAHYDHVGVRGDVIYNGADDNGSGTTGLLALAEALADYGPMRRSVVLIWVSGEEKGLWGAKAWAQNPSLPEGHRAVVNINTDMIGRNAPNVLYVTPSAEHKDFNGLTELAERFGAEEGFGAFEEGRAQGFEGLGSADSYYFRSDHAEFAKMEIPVCFLFAGEHEDYHQPGDTPDKIDCDKIRRVERTVLKMLDALQTDTLEL